MNQVVMQLVHHHQPEVFPALLEGRAIEFTQHRFHTGCIMVAVEGESCLLFCRTYNITKPNMIQETFHIENKNKNKQK